MRRLLGGGTVLLCMLALAASESPAQERSAQFGVAAGLSLPIGDLGEGYGSGFHIGGAIQVGTSGKLGWRFEGTYTKFTADLAASDFRILSAAANAVLSGSGATMAPYAIGGLGVYNGKADAAENGSTDVGINVGAGAKFALSGFDSFIEVRFHNVFGDGSNSRWIPITFGILF